MQTITLDVFWRARNVATLHLSLTDNDAFATILNAVEAEVGPLWAPRVLVGGRKLTAGVSLGKFLPNIPEESLDVVIFGALASDVEQLHMAGASAPRLKADLATDTTAIESAARSHANAKPRALRPQTYGFGSIEVLDMPDSEHARSILEGIASDRRVLAVMKARGWLVPILKEMYPSGKVGVDPVCVLGLNVNSGQEIQLRIRTDDQLGFRKIGIVMKTVWHELAHNLISEHTGQFYALVTELERQGEAADWTKSGGRVLGGSGEPAAAYSRAISSGSAPPSSAPVLLPVVQGQPSGDTLPEEKSTACACGHPSHEHGADEAQPEPLAQAPDHAPESSVQPKETPGNSGSSAGIDSGMDADLPPEVAAAMEAAAARQARMHDACIRLRSDCRTAGVDYPGALTLLKGVVGRAAEAGRGCMPADQAEKLRAIRPSNSAFLRGTAGSSGAVELLLSTGFRSTQREGVQWLVLPSNADPGLLWLAQSILEQQAND